MSKAILFDMDGTIADLYSVESWLSKLRAEDASPYRDAQPMYDMPSLCAIVETLRDAGYRIAVVTWGSIGATPAYSRAIRREKLAWLKRHGFPYDDFHCVKYGTPKSSFITEEISILVDDNMEVRESFIKGRKGKVRDTIDASKSILKPLLNLLLAE